MRCPKCHYISYDSQDRCRNCGYEFSFAVDVEAIDLPMQTGDEPLGPLEDFSLRAIDDAVSGTGAVLASAPDMVLSELDLAARPVPDSRAEDLRVALREPPAVPTATLTPTALDVRDIEIGGKPEKGKLRPASLPFNDKPARDAGQRWTPSAPRAPLAVRRPTPTPAPRRPAPPAFREPELDLMLPEPSEPARVHEPPATRREPAAVAARQDGGIVAAPAGPRLGAAAIDVLILGAIDAMVLYLTLRLCGLTAAQVLLLPAAPMIAFLLLLAGGYVVAFTAAGGQTIGKMACGIRVVPVSSSPAWDDRVPLGVAVLRAAACLVSLIPAGLGFVPALFGPEHRALHDRFADTRVIQA